MTGAGPSEMALDHRLLLFVIFFFQAEDGIRDLTVTGVQTCALPIFGMDFEELQERNAAEIPVRRVGRPEDIAHTVAFFVSEAAGFVSGQVIYVAGEIGRASCRERV